MRTPRILAALIAVLLAAPATLRAQEGDAAAPAGPSDAAPDLAEARDRLHLLLLRPDVRRVAEDRGIDLGPIHEGVESLDAAMLARIDPYALALEDQPAAAAQAVTLSTTTIIIGLLVIILLVLIL